MFKPGWKMTLFTLGFSPLLFTLGQWQLDREAEKIQIQKEYDSRAVAGPVDIETINWASDDLNQRNISFEGRYLNQFNFLLDNRIYEGKVGYEVITPVEYHAGKLVLVNRGWIAQGSNRTDIPEIEAIDDRVNLSGKIYVPNGKQFLLDDAEEISMQQGHSVIQEIDVEKIAAYLEIDIAPFTIRLNENSPGKLQDNWVLVNMSPEKHRAYAVQWFLMLFALIGMYLYFGFKNAKSEH